ncbi:MAG TPA: DUF1707 domain-containing protein [Nocardioides sp.]|uniref:DUF1707 SHOCT-like domain-containing protein n=1 Tax=Nocardioides sp. TaxID=35761 RepID=UPI002CC989FB|nr:DUF1707 domain-containing protein [Nocardioides sp.]HQR27133.1 DUF1707 domain-containing protein [Nocardioides sp.]
MVDPQKKARDADRDAAIEVVEAAYADGQITQPDYDLRVDRLLRAHTVGEVQGLVHDLRRDPDEEVTDVVEAVTGDSVAARPTRPLPTARPAARPGRALLLVAALVGGILLAVLVPIWLASRGGDGVSAGPVGLGDRTSLLTPSGYAFFVEELEGKTGSREAFSLVLYPGYAVVDVPVDETSQREFSWYFDGDWSEFGGAGTSTDDRFSVDQVDGTVIAEGIDQAKAGVEDATTWYAIVSAPDRGSARTCVTAYASNDFQETSYVRLTCDGSVVE